MRLRYFSLLSILILSLLGCLPFLGSSQPAQDPEAVVKAFMHALAEQRLDDAAPLMTAEYRKLHLSRCPGETLTECSQKAHQRSGQLFYEMQGTEINGDQATVNLRGHRESDPVMACMRFTLKKRQNSWLISAYWAWMCAG